MMERLEKFPSRTLSPGFDPYLGAFPIFPGDTENLDFARDARDGCMTIQRTTLSQGTNVLADVTWVHSCIFGWQIAPHFSVLRLIKEAAEGPVGRDGTEMQGDDAASADGSEEDEFANL
jgi:hypothetical protein